MKPKLSAIPAPRKSKSVSAGLEKLDAQLSKAGLVRSRRAVSEGAGIKARTEQQAPEELRPASAHVNIAINGVQFVAVPAWKKLDWLWHGFSTRRGGVSQVYAAEGAAGELNLGFTADDARDHVLQNRRLLAEAITGDADVPLLMLRQVHSSVLVLAGKSAPGQPCKGDGLITDRPGILIGVQTADCIPVLVADRKRKVVGAFHAGWRGTVKRIQEPGHSAARTSRHVDLMEANRRQLLAGGVKAQAISLVGGCTHCQRDLFFSYRAEKGRTGRMLSVIGIRA